MKRTWIVLIISVIVLIAAFLFFIFPGYYFTLESRNVLATCPPVCTTSAIPSVPTGETPTFSSGGATPSASKSSSDSLSSSPEQSATPVISSSLTPSVPSHPIYDYRAREQKIKGISDYYSKTMGRGISSLITSLVLVSFLSFLLNFPFRDIFYFLFSSIFEILGLRKKRRPWGVIYNSFDKRPLAGAVVKIIEVNSGNVRETRVTDNQGRFGFLVEKGKYELTVAKPGFVFPSRKIVLNKNKSDGYFSNVYLGGPFLFKENFLSMNIPLDMQKKPSTSTKYFVLFLRFARFFERFRFPLLIFGTLFSFFNLYLFRSILDLIFVLIYILLWFFEIIERRKIKPYGEVQDEDGEFLDLVVVRFFRQDSDKLVATTITNKEGKFFVLLPRGNYFLTASRGDYFLSTLKNVHISQASPKEIKIIMKSAVKSGG